MIELTSTDIILIAILFVAIIGLGLVIYFILNHLKKTTSGFVDNNKYQNIRAGLNSSVIVTVTDAKGVITQVNDNFCKISKYSSEELIGKTHIMINSGYHEPQFFKNMWRVISSGNVWKGEICNKAKDGNFYWVDTTIIPFLDSENRPTEYLSIRYEISNTKHKERLLNLINVLQDSFIRHQNLTEDDYSYALNLIIDLSESENAILATTTLRENDTYQVNKIVAVTKETKSGNIEEQNNFINHLLKQTVKEKNVFITNTPTLYTDKNMGITHDISSIHSFMGIPLFAGTELIGVIGLSNRSTGYNQDMFFKLESVFTTLANSILNMNIRYHEREHLNDLKSLVSSLNDIVFELDEEGRFLRVWSSNNEVMFMPKEQFIGKTISECLPATMARLCYDALKYIVKHEGTTKQFEYPSMYKDNRWFLTKFFEIKRDSPDAKKKICCVITDITERKLMETEIRESTEIFKSLSDNVPVLVWMSDINGSLNFFNKSWLEFTGRKTESDIGEGWYETVHPDDRGLVQKKFLRATHDRGSFTITYRMKNTSGEYRWVKNHGVPRANERGDFIGFIGSCFDLTEEFRLQQNIKDKEKFLSEMAKVAKIGGWELNPSNYTFTFSDEVYAILESETREEINLSQFITFFEDDSQTDIQKKFSQAIEKNQGFEFESKLQRLNKWTKVAVKVETLNTGTKRIFGILHDVTEQKLAEQELDQQKGLALQSSKMAALGEMAGNISHEINNPLAIIHGSAEQLKRLVDNKQIVDENVVKIINRIVNTTQRISKIVKGLRSFSREAELDPFVPALVSELIDETLALCESRLKHQGVRIDVNLFDPLVKIDCKSIQISQVMLNLINNSTDAIALLQDKWIRIACEKLDEETIELSVTDAGGGIPTEVATKLMQPFFTTKETGKGTGLGLYVSRVILHNHGGALTVDPKSPNTKFVLRLPIKQTSTNEIKKAS
jgi:PAS domain S-box-containing protein